jgi:hypothetical protein
MTTLVDFTPSAIAVFQFLATLDDGVQYNVSAPWNALGERYYVSVADLAGNVVANRAIVQSGPVFRGTMSWALGEITASLLQPHNVPIGEVVNARITQTNTPMDGLYLARATDSMALALPLAANPNQATPIVGKVDFPLDLLAGYDIGRLYFHADTQQFEF